MKRPPCNRLFSVVPALLVVTALIISGASCAPRAEVTDRIGVIVTLLPRAEFVASVGGEKVSVTVMVPPGASPHAYEPTPSQMVTVTRAKMYAKVGSGIDFELVWMDKLVTANQKMLIVDCSDGVQLQKLAGAQERSALDPHIWLSPLNARLMVQNIANGLMQIDPDNLAYYEKNRDAYLQKLTRLDRDIRDSLSAVTNRRFMVYHEGFGYFARDYNITMLPIEEEGKEPTAIDIADLIKLAKEHKIKVIFTSPQFNPQSARVIAEAIDGRVVFIDPLAGDYIDNMYRLLREMVQAME